jgi:hypothetical protein
MAQIPGQQLLKRGQTLFNRFLKYQVAVVTLRDIPVNEVANVFERMPGGTIR